MKLGKKAVTLLSFAVGACVFVSTAFADMTLGTGYDRLKSAIKQTAAQMDGGLDNYTLETLMTLKANGQTMVEASQVNKVDNVGKASEDISTTRQFGGNTYSHYTYSDPWMSVMKNSQDDVYYVNEFPDGRGGNWSAFSNPFEEDGAQEIEKIVDALVGNLKDYVQVEETSEGGKIYSGSLSSAQVPALVNAVTSFVMKQIIRDQGRFGDDDAAKFPEMESDIFVSKVTGTAVENASGLLENLVGEVVLNGKDKDGASHDITMNIMFKLTDVGTTKVEKPDLSNAKVEKYSAPRFGIGSKHIGTYKNNIILETDGEIIKIGERTLEITSAENGRVTGRFYETVKPEYADKYPEPYNIVFESNPDISSYSMTFTYTNAKGEQEAGQLHPAGRGKIYVDLGLEINDKGEIHGYKGRPDFDGDMIRVFEE
jgi:hypothetical protein